MEISELAERYSAGTSERCKAIFSTLFIAANRLQTLFDHRIPRLTLRQFMLLSIARQSVEPLTLTELGKLLGCSRQNVKKLALSLEQKGFARLCRSQYDARALTLVPTETAEEYFRTEFPQYAGELGTLFSVYSEDEVRTLFELMMRMYAGLDKLEALTLKGEDEK